MSAAPRSAGISTSSAVSDTRTSKPVATTREYDPVLDRWTDKAPLPLAKNYGAGVAANGRFYVLGGGGNGSALDAVYEYSPFLDGWSTRASIGVRSVHQAAAAVQ